MVAVTPAERARHDAAMMLELERLRPTPPAPARARIDRGSLAELLDECDPARDAQVIDLHRRSA